MVQIAEIATPPTRTAEPTAWRETVASPLGDILLIGRGEALLALDFADCEARMMLLLRRHFGALSPKPVDRPSRAAACLARYFAGELRALDAVAVETRGTPFQERTWRKLRQVPAGRTVSYGGLAKRIGRPRAVRAVGLANARNPVALVIPCHRVIGADRALTGYAGGIERKRWLLAHEGALGAAV
jgi:methylated-DNA-[protein]-cysteine S-methyltransferase